jgi:hypothetical protein
MNAEIYMSGCSNVDALLYLKSINKNIAGLLFRESQVEISSDRESTQWLKAQDVYEKGIVRNEVQSGTIVLRIGYARSRALKLLNDIAIKEIGVN